MEMRKVLIISLMAASAVMANTPIMGINVVKEFHLAKEARWERMVWAICEKESHNDDSAKNPKSSAAGRFQMLKVYVDEVNRLCGKKAYKYADRHNPEKAREMFDIYQSYHNPQKDVDKAILLHRGKKDWKYFNEVKRLMEE